MLQRVKLEELLVIFTFRFLNLLNLKVGKLRDQTHVGFGE